MEHQNRLNLYATKTCCEIISLSIKHTYLFCESNKPLPLGDLHDHRVHLCKKLHIAGKNVIQINILTYTSVSHL